MLFVNVIYVNILMADWNNLLSSARIGRVKMKLDLN